MLRGSLFWDTRYHFDLLFVLVRTVPTATSACTTHGYLTVSAQQDGYIPLSSAAGAASPGARRCPWKITVDPNQRLEFSVLAFGLRQFQTGNPAPPPPRRGGRGYCAWALVFEEGPICVVELLYVISCY